MEPEVRSESHSMPPENPESDPAGKFIMRCMIGIFAGIVSGGLAFMSPLLIMIPIPGVLFGWGFVLGYASLFKDPKRTAAGFVLGCTFAYGLAVGWVYAEISGLELSMSQFMSSMIIASLIVYGGAVLSLRINMPLPGWGWLIAGACFAMASSLLVFLPAGILKLFLCYIGLWTSMMICLGEAAKWRGYQTQVIQEAENRT